jgi:TrmH family RNA methyltransferase
MPDSNSISCTYERITSRNNPLIVTMAKLDQKKHRDKAGLFLIDGVKLYREAKAAGSCIFAVFIKEDAADEIISSAGGITAGTRVIMVPESVMDRITDERFPEGMVTAVKYSSSVKREQSADDFDAKFYDGRRILILDGIQDTGNMGAIMRSARAFGIDTIICGSGCADVYGRRVMRASMGAALRLMSVYIDNLSDVCCKLLLAGRRIFAACPDGDKPCGGNFEPEGGFQPFDCIVIGNEGHGVSDDILSLCTGRITVPMSEGQESLNAACAATVILWERYKSELCGI